MKDQPGDQRDVRRPWWPGWVLLAISVLLLLTVLLGCTDPAVPAAGGPLPWSDAASVSAGVARMDSVLATPAMQGVIALGGLMTTRSPAASFAERCGQSAAASVHRAEAAAGGTGPIADSLYGHVFAWDTAAGGYRVGADSGGPAGGVRFLLYALNPYGRPSLPLTGVGWLDLGNGGNGALPGVTVRLGSGGVSLADLVATLSGTATADTVLLAGSVGDGVHTFVVRDSAARGGTHTTTAAALDDSTDGLQVRLFASRISFDPFDYNDTLDLSYTHDAETVRVAGSITTYCLIPSVGMTASVNGVPFAAIVNSSTSIPAVTRLDKLPITATQVQAILDLKNAAQTLFAALIALAAPPALLLP